MFRQKTTPTNARPQVSDDVLLFYTLYGDLLVSLHKIGFLDVPAITQLRKLAPNALPDLQDIKLDADLAGCWMRSYQRVQLRLRILNRDLNLGQRLPALPPLHIITLAINKYGKIGDFYWFTCDDNTIQSASDAYAKEMAHIKELLPSFKEMAIDCLFDIKVHNYLHRALCNHSRFNGTSGALSPLRSHLPAQRLYTQHELALLDRQLQIQNSIIKTLPLADGDKERALASAKKAWTPKESPVPKRQAKRADSSLNANPSLPQPHFLSYEEEKPRPFRAEKKTNVTAALCNGRYSPFEALPIIQGFFNIYQSSNPNRTSLKKHTDKVDFKSVVEEMEVHGHISPTAKTNTGANMREVITRWKLGK